MSQYKAKSAAEHRTRGSCCKSGCLHCPWGVGIKMHGFEFVSLTATKDSATDSGERIKEGELTDDVFIYEGKKPEDSLYEVTHKGHACARIRADKLLIRKMLIHPDFNDQGISVELLESYLF